MRYTTAILTVNYDYGTKLIKKTLDIYNDSKIHNIKPFIKCRLVHAHTLVLDTYLFDV